MLWDLDPQGAASFMFRVKPRVKGGGKALIRGTRALDDAIKGTDFDNLDLIPADFTYRNMDLLAGQRLRRRPGGKPARKLAKLLAPLAAEYDAMFLDCPPGISLVSENVLHAADVIVVPLIPTTLSVRTLDQLTEFVAEFDGRRPDVLAFFSMVDRRKNLHREITEKFSSNGPGWPPPSSRLSPVVENMSVERAPVTVFAPRSAAARPTAPSGRSCATSARSPSRRPSAGSSRSGCPGGRATGASAPAAAPADAAAWVRAA